MKRHRFCMHCMPFIYKVGGAGGIWEGGHAKKIGFEGEASEKIWSIRGGGGGGHPK